MTRRRRRLRLRPGPVRRRRDGGGRRRFQSRRCHPGVGRRRCRPCAAHRRRRMVVRCRHAARPPQRQPPRLSGHGEAARWRHRRPPQPHPLAAGRHPGVARPLPAHHTEPTHARSPSPWRWRRPPASLWGLRSPQLCWLRWPASSMAAMVRSPGSPIGRPRTADFSHAVLDRAADGSLFMGVAIYFATDADLGRPARRGAGASRRRGRAGRRWSATCSSATRRRKRGSTSGTATTAPCLAAVGAVTCDFSWSPWVRWRRRSSRWPCSWPSQRWRCCPPGSSWCGFTGRGGRPGRGLPLRRRARRRFRLRRHRRRLDGFPHRRGRRAAVR